MVFGEGIDGTHLAEVWLWHLIAVCLDKQKPQFARLYDGSDNSAHLAEMLFDVNDG